MNWGFKKLILWWRPSPDKDEQLNSLNLREMCIIKCQKATSPVQLKSAQCQEACAQTFIAEMVLPCHRMIFKKNKVGQLLQEPAVRLGPVCVCVCVCVVCFFVFCFFFAGQKKKKKSIYLVSFFSLAFLQDGDQTLQRGIQVLSQSDHDLTVFYHSPSFPYSPPSTPKAASSVQLVLSH